MIYSVIYFYMTSLCRLFYCIKKGWGQGDTPSKPLFHYVYKPYYIRRQRQPDLRKFVGEGIFWSPTMVQGRGSTNSSAKANFAFADEWFKVGGRRQRQNLPFQADPLPSLFVGKGLCRRICRPPTLNHKWFQAGSREGRGSA